MSLKNKGVTAPVVIIALIVFGTIIYSLFDPTTSIGRAPVANKILGTVLGVAAIAYMFASDRLLDFIRDDKRKLLFQILGTIALAVLSLLVLAVFHSGPLGTTTNP